MTSHPTPSDDAPDQTVKDQQLELGEEESLTALRRAWERTLRALAGSVNKQTIGNWLRPLRPLSYSPLPGPPVVVLGAPSSFARTFVETKYAQTLALHLAQFLDVPAVQVRFVISTPDVQPLLGENPLPLQQAAAPLPRPAPDPSSLDSLLPVPAGQSALALTPDDGTPAVVGNGIGNGVGRGGRSALTAELVASPLNPRYTFDNFVVGKSNRLAHSGAAHVADAPGKMYNPLFLYGSPGLGKCVAASEFLHLADGRRVQAGSLIGTEFSLLTLAKEELRAVPAWAEFNAVEPVFAVQTESGRRIVRNAQHPLWAANGDRVRGWTALADIHEGDLVAVPECLPAFGAPIPLPEHEVERLASLVGDGECPAHRVPPAVFRLPPEQLRLFLGRLFSAGGQAPDAPHAEVEFRSASETLVRDVQELLLKLGILGHIARKSEAAWAFAIDPPAEQMNQNRPGRGLWRHREAPFRMRWERVTAVESAGVEATVAVEVPDYHTFLSTFWEHNTHLMHAIGHQIRLTLPQARVAYVNGETFTNHYVSALRDKRTEDFRRAYRSVDVWLVDDVQMLASKEQTKEEFFHTFNVLHQMNKQIVLTSDRSPRELKAMDERLQSRFECGLVADIAPPELEMREAILQRKAILENLLVPDDVITFMANLIQSNIRSLEGALIKLMAYASLARSPVTKQLASDVLSSYYVKQTPQARETASAHPEDHAPPGGGPFAFLPRPPMSAGGPGVDRILDAVAAQMGVSREQILAGGGRSNRATRLHGDAGFARQVAMYLTKEIGGVPLSTLAATFGLKSHTAIVHAAARLQKEIEDDPQILSLIARIRQEIERGG